MADPLSTEFQVTGNPYGEQNLAAVATGTVSKPDYSDPLKLRQYYMDELGVPGALTELQSLNQAIGAFDTSTEQTLNAIENKPIRMGVITGEQAATERSRSTTRNSLVREQIAKQSFVDSARNEAENRFSLANAERQKLQELILSTNGKAGISYADSFEQATKKAGDYMEKKAEEDKKEAEKDYLKKLALEYGVSSKGSRKDIRKRIEKVAKKDKNAKQALSDLEYALKKKELNKPYYEPKSGGTIDLSDKGIADVIQQGYNSGDDWQTIAETLTANGIGTAPGSTADKYLRHKFLGEDSPF
jgi:hypothetical protein